MSKNIAVALSAIAVLSIAFVFAVFGDQFSRSSLDRLAPQEQVEYARHYFDMAQAHDLAGMQRALDPAIAKADIAEKLEQVTTLFPKGKPVSVDLVGTKTLNKSDGAYYSLTFEYAYPASKWVAANLVLKLQDGKTFVEGIHVDPLTDSIEHADRFTLQGTGLKQIAVLLGALALLAFDIYVLALCIKTPLLKYKWLWIIFILLGLGDIGFGWQSGTFFFFHNQTGRHIIVMLPVVIFSKWLYQPLFITFRIPFGAVAFFVKQKMASVKAG